MENQIYIGIDISKCHFDLYVLPESKEYQFENNPKGIRQCLHVLRQVRTKLIVMESTGGYEVALATELHLAGLAVAVVNPRQIRDFARAVGADSQDRQD